MKFKLRPNETVEWRSKKGTGFWARMFLGFMGMLLFLVFFQYLSNGWNLGILVQLIGVMAGVVVFIIYCIRGNVIEYRLTNQRIVVTTFGRITKEYPLKLWEGKPVSQYLQKHISYHGGGPRYNVNILHPKTLDKILHCKDVNPSAIKILEKIGHIIKCKYCQTTNSVFNARCVHCGGSL